MLLHKLYKSSINYLPDGSPEAKNVAFWLIQAATINPAKPCPHMDKPSRLVNWGESWWRALTLTCSHKIKCCHENRARCVFLCASEPSGAAPGGWRFTAPHLKSRYWEIIRLNLVKRSVKLRSPRRAGEIPEKQWGNSSEPAICCITHESSQEGGGGVACVWSGGPFNCHLRHFVGR